MSSRVTSVISRGKWLISSPRIKYCGRLWVTNSFRTESLRAYLNTPVVCFLISHGGGGTIPAHVYFAVGLMKNLNEAQRRAVEHTIGPAMIIAGAGTGKTTVITEKFVHLITEGLATPEEILALTFTEKAAGEMEERIEARLTASYTRLHISTFHTFCKEILEHYALEVGLPDRFSLLTPIDAWLLVKRHWSRFDLDYYAPIGNPSKHIRALIDHFGKCKDELISPEAYRAYADSFESDIAEEVTKIREVARAYETYCQLLLDHSSLDLSDLIFYTYRLFTERPHVLSILQKQFRYIFVDEFQDVNWSQYQLVRLLAGEAGNLTVVGDDDQSIYAFRGASVSNIMRFRDDYPESEQIVLTENYRSTQEILDTAYLSVRHNDPDRLETKLHIDKKLAAQTEGGSESVFHIHTTTHENEVDFVVQRIRELYEQGEDVSWDDFAILVRSNNQAEPFMHALNRAGIPYEFLAARGLFRERSVLDALSFFRLMRNYRDDRSMYRLLRLTSLDLKESDLHEILNFARKCSIPYMEAARKVPPTSISAEGSTQIGALLDVLHASLHAVRKNTPTSLLFHFFEASGYLGYLTRAVENGDQEAIRQTYQLNQFFSFISDFEKLSPEHDVNAFIEYIEELEEAGEQGSLYQPVETKDSVNILTVHSSKGLEFSYVFVVNLVEQRFPTYRKSPGIELPEALIHETLPEGDAHYQEERRLFYVAMTRAKEQLYLAHADYYEGAKRKKKISRFLGELDFGESIEKTELVDRRPVDISKHRQSESHRSAEFVYDTPKRFSFSQIRSYDTCPYQYKLSSILKIRTPGGAAASFGKSLHNTLQKFYEEVIRLNSPEQASLFGPMKTVIVPTEEQLQVPGFEELLRFYQKNWIPYDYESESQRKRYRKEGEHILRIFYDANDGHWTVPASVEGWFKIMVGEHTVHGRMDRVDLKPDGRL
ncbi:MAG: hypothetical protein COV67_13105, partial [Nitrospinae bacterium CG11_big_fil_rev_8_21_14_0_20_56_8]